MPQPSGLHSGRDGGDRTFASRAGGERARDKKEGKQEEEEEEEVDLKRKGNYESKLA